MTYRSVALIGRARSGKDSIAARLAVRHGYVRVALADPVRAVALALDPIIRIRAANDDGAPLRLAELVDRHGWEYAKTTPEVRRTLQALGEGMRQQDRRAWLRLALDQVAAARRWNIPVVITDVRYANEAEAFRAAGFELVRVVRPGHAGADTAAARAHVSESALPDVAADRTVVNGGTLADLDQVADTLAVPLPRAPNSRTTTEV